MENPKLLKTSGRYLRRAAALGASIFGILTLVVLINGDSKLGTEVLVGLPSMLLVETIGINCSGLVKLFLLPTVNALLGALFFTGAAYFWRLLTKDDNKK